MSRIKGSMVHKLVYLFLFFVYISAGLFFVRFVVPALPFGICEVKGTGPRTRTVCLKLIEFRGNDFLSIYRIDLARKRR